jgi:hypothetical protein
MNRRRAVEGQAHELGRCRRKGDRGVEGGAVGLKSVLVQRERVHLVVWVIQLGGRGRCAVVRVVSFVGPPVQHRDAGRDKVRDQRQG